MSITSALSNALSGLNVASRGVEIVSDNVANAQTEGYAKRELAISARTIGGYGAGVKIDGIERRVDTVLLQERRTSQGSLGQADTLSKGLARLEANFGDPTEPGSLTQRVAQLSSDLISASSRPDSTARLDLAVQTAGGLADYLNDMSRNVQEVRRTADQAIAQDVDVINQALEQIAEIDERVVRLGQGQRDVTGLLDERQAAVDQISSILPIREAVQSNGKIELFTSGGAILYDGRPAVVEFSPKHTIEADLTLAGGDLSAVTINGVSYSSEMNASKIKGGSLYANFVLRDQVAVEAQTNLDAFARDLIERFQDPSVDATLAAGDPGLFADGTLAFDPVDEVGVAGRIALNSNLDPSTGGAAWRLRDGLGAAITGPTGDATLLTALQSRLDETRTVASGAANGANLTTAALSAEIQSIASVARQDADRTLAYEAAQFDTLQEAELRNGVDTDEELRNLLLLEQAYAANARVISTVDDLLNTLLRI